MTNLVNDLRIYALDLHMLGGFNKYSLALSKAADYIEKMEAQNVIRTPGNIWRDNEKD